MQSLIAKSEFLPYVRDPHRRIEIDSFWRKNALTCGISRMVQWPSVRLIDWLELYGPDRMKSMVSSRSYALANAHQPLVYRMVQSKTLENYQSTTAVHEPKSEPTLQVLHSSKHEARILRFLLCLKGFHFKLKQYLGNLSKICSTNRQNIKKSVLRTHATGNGSVQMNKIRG